jgi:hypothetical protein
MKPPRDERELLDEQEAAARAGIERAVRGLGVDLMDVLALPEAWREHELFEAGVSATANAIGHEATVTLIAGALAATVAKPAGLRAILRRAVVESALAIAAMDGTGSGPGARRGEP